MNLQSFEVGFLASAVAASGYVLYRLLFKRNKPEDASDDKNAIIKFCSRCIKVNPNEKRPERAFLQNRLALYRDREIIHYVHCNQYVTIIRFIKRDQNLPFGCGTGNTSNTLHPDDDQIISWAEELHVQPFDIVTRNGRIAGEGTDFAVPTPGHNEFVNDMCSKVKPDSEVCTDTKNVCDDATIDALTVTKVHSNETESFHVENWNPICSSYAMTHSSSSCQLAECSLCKKFRIDWHQPEKVSEPQHRKKKRYKNWWNCLWPLSCRKKHRKKKTL